MLNIERFRVRKLRDEMNDNLRSVINSLNSEQRDLFKEEEERCVILAHLEQVHKELQGEHIQDQVAGGELRRRHSQLISDLDVEKHGIETEKVLLKKQIEQIQTLIGIVKKQIEAEEKSGKEIQ